MNSNMTSMAGEICDISHAVLECLVIFVSQTSTRHRSDMMPATRVTDMNPSQMSTRFKTIARRIMLYIFVTGGFVYQIGLICDDYFKYPTTTFVSIVSALPITIPPKIAIRVYRPPNDGE